MNLEALTLAVLMFAAYALLLAIGWGVAHWAWPRGTDKWFWPNAKRTVAYIGVSAMNVMLGLTFLFVVVRRSPPVLLGVTLVMSLIAIAATFCIVQYQDNKKRRQLQNNEKTRQLESPSLGGNTSHGVLTVPRIASLRGVASATHGTGAACPIPWFLMARVSFLFVVGVVPAMAAFQVAEGYENGLLVGRRSMHARSELAARIERIVRQQHSLRLCSAAKGCPETTAAFLKQRLKPLAYEVPVPATNTTYSQASSAMIGLASTLALGHRAYNNVAVDLQAAMPGDPVGIFQPDVGYLVLGAVLALLIVFVVRKLVWPLYALDLYRPPGFEMSLGHKPSDNVLLVGPAGSGKTDFLLRRTPGSRVFDVGTLAFVEVGDAPPPLWPSASQYRTRWACAGRGRHSGGFPEYVCTPRGRRARDRSFRLSYG